MPNNIFMGRALVLQTVPRTPCRNDLCQLNWMLPGVLSGRKFGEEALAEPGDLSRNWGQDILESGCLAVCMIQAGGKTV